MRRTYRTPHTTRPRTARHTGEERGEPDYGGASAHVTGAHTRTRVNKRPSDMISLAPGPPRGTKTAQWEVETPDADRDTRQCGGHCTKREPCGC